MVEVKIIKSKEAAEFQVYNLFILISKKFGV